MRALLKIWLSIAFISIGIGLVLLFVATVSGFAWSDIQNVSTITKSETYTDITSIDIKLGYGEIYLKEGDEFSIRAIGVIEDEFESYVQRNKWIIRHKNNNRSGVSIFGNRINFGSITNIGDQDSPKIYITVPQGFLAEKILLDIGAGSFEAERIETIEGAFIVGAGAISIKDLKATGKTEYRVGAGEIDIKKIEAVDITVNCGIGSVVMNGIILGNNKIDCGVGSVALNIAGNVEDYSYQANTSIGSITINGNSYNGVVKYNKNKSNADNSFILKCGIGEIALTFK